MAEPDPNNVCGDLDSVTGIGKAVGDQLRATILVLLKEDSFSVSELCQMLNVAQPALSHHLKILLKAGLIARRREANNLFYRRDNSSGDRLKLSLFSVLDEIGPAPELLTALSEVHRQRSRHCRHFFAANAAEIASLQTQIAEPAAYSDSVADMAQRVAQQTGADSLALEVGPGDGSIITGLTRCYAEVHGLDSSAEMLARTENAIAGMTNVALLDGDFLDYQPELRYDLIVAAMTVHHMPSPAAFFLHAGSLLNPGGSVIVAELRRHDQQWASEVCGDLWLGFEPAELSRWAVNAGLDPCESQFLAQKNGFQIQIQRYVADQPSSLKEVP